MLLVFLLALTLPVSVVFWIISLFYNSFTDGHCIITPWRWLIAVLFPVLIARWGLHKKSLDKSGAVTGLVVGFLLTISNLSFFASLLAFFVTASKATKYKSSLKKKFEDDFKEGGQRNWIQVLCNGGVAAQFAVLYMLDGGCREKTIDFKNHYSLSMLSVSVLGSLACCAGDTFASEIGTVFRYNTEPRLITSFRKVPKGTNGGITLMGTVSSGLGGLLVGVAYYVMLILMTGDYRLHDSPAQWPIVVTGLIAGLLGSSIDSYMGAWFQYSGYHRNRKCIVERPGPDVEHISGTEILDNHSVNLLSSLFTGLLMPRIAFIIWPYFT